MTSEAKFDQWDNDVDRFNIELAPGQRYTMDIVHAERRTDQSTFPIDTSIQCFAPK